MKQGQPINPIETRLLLSEFQTRLDAMEAGVIDLNGRVALIPTTNDNTAATPQAVNQIRNGSFSHSVNSWANVVTANNGRYECAYWFSNPVAPNVAMYKNDQIVGPVLKTMGVVDTGADTIVVTGHGLTTGSAFTITGSRPSPLALATVYYAIVIDANTIQVASSYADAEAGTFIPLTTTTTGGSLNFNFTLKNSASTEYSIEYSDWDIATGVARFAPMYDITSLIPGNNIEAGYPFFANFSIALANQYIYAPQDIRIFAGLYGYSTGDTEWDWIGGPFEATADVLGTVGTPTSREYRILAETNRGFSIISDVLTVASAPSDPDFANGARVFISWPAVLNYGITSYSVYRNTGGTYVRLFTLSSTLRQYIDNGSFQSAEVGWPAADFDKLVAYTASGTGGVTAVPYAGDPNVTGWTILPFAIRVPQNYDKGDSDLTKGQWLRFGLNKNLAIRVPNGSISAFPYRTLTTTVGQFNSSMVGKAISMVNSKGSKHAATVTAYTDADNITFLPGWPEGFNEALPVTAIIEESAPPHSVFMDLTHLSYISGAGFSPNSEDISPLRGIPAAVPNGTTQEGPPPAPPTGDDGFPPRWCLFETQPVEIENGEIAAIDLEVGMKLPDGFGGFNTLVQKELGYEDVFLVETQSKAILCTESKKIYVSDTERKPLKHLEAGDEIVVIIDGKRVLEKIEQKIFVKKGLVVRVSLSPNHSFIAGGVLIDNRKPDVPLPE